MKEKHTIVAVHITDRLKEAVEVQKILTHFGGQIKTRLGLHEVATGQTGLNGLLLLEMVGPDASMAEMMSRLNALEGVECKSLTFEHT